MSSEFLPLPGVASRTGPYEIRVSKPDGGGYCKRPLNGDIGVFCAPLTADSAYARAVRQHEYGHLALLWRGLHPSEERMASIQARGIDNAWVQGALDVFVNGFMKARGNSEIGLLVPWQGEFKGSLERALAALLYLRCEGLDEEAERRIELAWRGLLTWEDMTLLQALARELRVTGEQSRSLSGDRLYEITRILQDTFGVGASLFWQNCAHPFGDAAEVRRKDHGQWGQFEIVDLVSGSVADSRVGRKRGPSRFGPLRYPFRALLPSGDGRPFGRMKSPVQSAVLVDYSASMKIDPRDIEAVLSHSEGATIAVYGSFPDSLQKGRLVIVARSGKYVPQQQWNQLLGRGNVVDGPSLQWLNRQPGKRTWVSDRRVTGIGDRESENLTQEAKRLVQNGRVRVMRHLFPTLTRRFAPPSPGERGTAERWLRGRKAGY